MAVLLEVDEIYIGDKEENKHANKKLRKGRGSAGKHAVIGLRERDGRVIAKPIAQTNSKTLTDMIKKNVEIGSVVCTDEFPAYDSLTLNTGYMRLPVKHSAKKL